MAGTTGPWRCETGYWRMDAQPHVAAAKPKRWFQFSLATLLLLNFAVRGGGGAVGRLGGASTPRGGVGPSHLD